MREERNKTHYPGGIFHVYNRGADGREIFLDEDDYCSYLERLSLIRQNFRVAILAYCLMPNHIHLLAQQIDETPIAQLIQALHTSHSKRFNTKHRRTGHLFQGRFRQTVVQRDSHLRHVIAYIHLNPVEANLARDASAYRWSSHTAYLSRSPRPIVKADEGLAYFNGKRRYQEFIADTLEIPKPKRWKRIADYALE